MSSRTKRSLYRPAPQSNVGQNKNRRKLAQGRLVSGSTQPPVSGPSKLKQGKDIIPPREDPSVTPRKRAPRETESRSPRPSLRQNSLDLSDSEIDFPQLKKTPVHVHHHPDVLVLDASRQTRSPDQAEVDVVVGYEKSPVRVVCHTTAGVEKHLRTSGEGLDHWTVDVDRVPRISLQEDTDNIPMVISPRVVREKRIEGGATDPSSSSRPVLVLQEQGREITPVEPHIPHYPQPNFDDSQESDSSTKAVSVPRPWAAAEPDGEDAQSVISDSDACSLLEYVGNTKKRSTPMKHPSKTPGKKKGQIVPSRYMQSAAKVSKSMSSERSFAVGKNSSQKSMEGPMPTKQRKPKSEPRTKRVNTPTASQHVSIPEKKTSTPTHDVSTLMSHDIDASAITAETSVVSIEDISHIKHDKKSSRHLANAKKSEEPVTQDQLDVLYARYLQWTYLDARSRMAFQSQEREAMAQLSGLWEENERMSAREAELRMELARIRHQNVLDDQLDVQESGLGPVLANLPKVEKEYNSLADSLDTTRHQIRTSGIYIPQDEDQFQAKLEAALMESEQLLGELSVMTRQATPHIKSFADALVAEKLTLESERDEMKGCTEMLAACQSLAIQETSLKIQDVQLQTSQT